MEAVDPLDRFVGVCSVLIFMSTMANEYGDIVDDMAVVI